MSPQYNVHVIYYCCIKSGRKKEGNFTSNYDFFSFQFETVPRTTLWYVYNNILYCTEHNYFCNPLASVGALDGGHQCRIFFFFFLSRRGSAIILLVFHSRPVGLLGHLLWGGSPNVRFFGNSGIRFQEMPKSPVAILAITMSILKGSHVACRF